MALHGRRRLTAGIGLGAAALALPLTAGIGAAAASGPRTYAITAVAGDSGIIGLPGVARLGPASGGTAEKVSFVLKERNAGALASAVSHGVRSFITSAQFAKTYGQTSANIKALETYLAKYGITSTAMADGIDVQTHGTVAEYNAALGVHQAMFRVPASAATGGFAARPAQVIHTATGPASLPGPIAKYVTAILGLSNYAGFASQAAHSVVHRGSGSTCAAVSGGLPDACNLPAAFASHYGLTGLYGHATGKGQTIGIVTLASADPTGPAYFWTNIAKVKRTGTLGLVNVDGGSGAPNWNAGTNETDLDIEQSGALAPGANVRVYQAPNSDYGFVDAYFEAATQDVASTVSASWAESETMIKSNLITKTESPGYHAAFDEAFLELAMQGQSNFVATGDEGAFQASHDLGSTNLSIGSPSDSPYTTAAGGTTLPYTATLSSKNGTATVTVKHERTWGFDYMWPAIAKLNAISYKLAAINYVVGGGGGFSAVYPTPAYQVGVSGTNDFHAYEYLTPIDYVEFNPGLVLPSQWAVTATPKLSTGKGTGRAVPDVSADADPETGYTLYAPSGASHGGVLQYGWGGTSFVAPQLNGATAVIDSYLGHRVGLWNPSIYRFAAGSGSPFIELSTASSNNDNLYYSGNPGQIYNPSTGLGLPNLTKLAASFKAAGF